MVSRLFGIPSNAVPIRVPLTWWSGYREDARRTCPTVLFGATRRMENGRAMRVSVLQWIVNERHRSSECSTYTLLPYGPRGA